MKLIVISSPVPIENEVEIITALFNEGLELFHLRKPETSAYDCKLLLATIDPAFYARIALHQHHSLAKEFGIKRIHFPGRERNNFTDVELNEWKRQGFTLSTSIHTKDELEALSELFDYAFFGPVFESISKPGYKPKEKVVIEKKKKTELIALGGITPVNVREVDKNKFDGVAVLGSIWSDPKNAINVFKSIKQ